MKQNEIIKIFRDTGALLEGHFLLSSGLHSSQYFQCARVLQYPQYAEELGADIAGYFNDYTIDFVISPAMGGIIIGHEAARALKARFIFTERSKETDEMILRRGFDIEEGENGLIVEDVLTTGRSVRELVNLLRKENARLVGTGFIVDRSSNRVKFGTPKYAILEMPVVTYPPEDCPLCKKGIPISKPGSRKKIAQ
ncbi:orotate phosphoribosyltransferase [bacterium BMS3Abin05]|nr:orotate phosphoribosyltransferase [bacterium BMS3Abin05]GBE27198.1 orotate phosphoribosyltransferase [bacterium BMS3Bbin03]HDL78584.1 orotate phosphoribosyltransferase [Bacteroidota bacterium]